MLRLLMIVGLLSGAGQVLALAPADNDQPPQGEQARSPILELSPDQFDFGTIWQGAGAKREFTVRNGGQSPLTIDVKSSCGCTVVTRPQSPLGPGESSKFTITYDTLRVGTARKRVTLMTNDPHQPRAVIQVKGEVMPIFTADPGYRLTMYGLSPDSVASRTIHLKNQYTEPLDLRIRSGSEESHFAAELRPTVAGSEYDLIVTTVPPLSQGFTRDKVIVETSQEDLPVLTFSLSARVEPRVVLRPTRLTVTPRITKQAARTVRVQYRADEPLKIEKIESTCPGVECTVLPPAPPRGDALVAFHTVRVNLPAYAEVPDEGAQVVIHTDDKEFSELTVKIIKFDPDNFGGSPDLPDELKNGTKGKARHPVQENSKDKPKDNANETVKAKE